MRIPPLAPAAALVVPTIAVELAVEPGRAAEGLDERRVLLLGGGGRVRPHPDAARCDLCPECCPLRLTPVAAPTGATTVVDAEATRWPSDATTSWPTLAPVADAGAGAAAAAASPAFAFAVAVAPPAAVAAATTWAPTDTFAATTKATDAPSVAIDADIATTEATAVDDVDIATNETKVITAATATTEAPTIAIDVTIATTGATTAAEVDIVTIEATTASDIDIATTEATASGEVDIATTGATTMATAPTSPADDPPETTYVSTYAAMESPSPSPSPSAKGKSAKAKSAKSGSAKSAKTGEGGKGGKSGTAGVAGNGKSGKGSRLEGGGEGAGEVGTFMATAATAPAMGAAESPVVATPETVADAPSEAVAEGSSEGRASSAETIAAAPEAMNLEKASQLASAAPAPEIAVDASGADVISIAALSSLPLLLLLVWASAL